MGMAVGDPRGGVTADINVTPMIDVMLVLLVIFMIVTPLISAGFQLKMPHGKNLESRPEETKDVILGIDKDGNFYLDPGDGKGKISPIKTAGMSRRDAAWELEKRLRDVYQTRIIDRILYFKADAALQYGVIEDALEIARRSGVRVLGAVTEQERGAFFGSKR